MTRRRHPNVTTRPFWSRSPARPRSPPPTLIRSRLSARDDVATKSTPTDIVTQTDVDSERLIRDRLTTVTPDAGFVGEEGGTSHGGRRLQWVVDPLDGTVNFWYRLPVLAVSIAAAVDGVVVAGAVVDVMSGETFSAALGLGSRLDGRTIAHVRIATRCHRAW